MRIPLAVAVTALPLATLPMAAHAQSTTASAAPSQVTLYELPAYLGRSVTITKATPDLATVEFAQRAQSMKVRGEWQVCTDAQYDGNCQTLTSSRKLIARTTVSSLRPAADAKAAAIAATTASTGTGSTTASGTASGSVADVVKNMDVADGVEGQDVAFFARPTLNGTAVSAGSSEKTTGDAYCRLAGFSSATYAGKARAASTGTLDMSSGKTARDYALRDLVCRR